MEFAGVPELSPGSAGFLSDYDCLLFNVVPNQDGCKGALGQRIGYRS